MTWYREISPIQEPFDTGIAPAGKAEMVFNVSVVKEASETLVEEIVSILEAASVGTWRGNIFGSSSSGPKEGTYLTVIEQGGLGPERTHNQISPPAYVRPSVQIIVRGDSYKVVRAMAREAYNALAGIRNTDVTGV